MPKSNEAEEVSSAKEPQPQDKPTLEDLISQINELNAIVNNMGFVNADHAKLSAKSSRLQEVRQAEFAKIKAIYDKDVAKITSMLEQGKISQQKAVSLANEVKTAFEKKCSEVDEAISQYGAEISANLNSLVVENYKKGSPEFFDDPIHSEVVEHLTSNYGQVSPKDLDFVRKIVAQIRNPEAKKLEKTASSAQEANKSDTTKLVSAVDAPSGAYQVGSKRFSREDIAKMSPAEYKKNEKIIFEQIQKGLIK